MNWDALGAIAELLGAIAVFLTLAYLAVQIKQSSKALDLQNHFAAAQIMQARTDTTIFFLSSIVSSSLNTKTAAELMSVKEDDSVESFSKEDTDRIFFILQMQRAMFENLYDQNKRGLLTEGYYEGAPTKNLKRIAGAFLAFKIAMSTEFEAEVRRVLALP
jgi:hypothetical protein